ncbi:MAG: ABC transporter permease [Ruminococcus sp.]|nr:ABC transporter permease [Ruminococcus sp.]MBQ8296221.1 ABC transporter permease [Ruminococcus sp.]
MFSIYKKELQSFFYTPFAYIITALFMLLFTYVLNTSIANMDSSMLQFSFTEIFYNVILFFIFLIPIMTMRTFSDERKFGTEVLLMTSPANVFKIVIAKFLGNVTVFAFMLVGSSLFPIVTAMNGAVVQSQLVCAYVGFFCWGIMCIALGMLISSFTENSIIAAILGEVAMLAVLFVDDFSRTAFVSQYPALQSVLDSFAAQTKFVYFAQGVIRLSDIIFFVSAVVLFLGWTIISIEKRRWNRG